MSSKRVVAFTGHRPDKLGGYKTPNATYHAVLQAIFDKLTELKPDVAISGMALGVDQWAAYACIKLNIPFVAAIPCDGHSSRWPPLSIALYDELLRRAAKIHVVSPGPYSARKMQVRNEWMVDNATDILAIWDGTPGGTGNCVAYAKRSSKPLHSSTPSYSNKYQSQHWHRNCHN